MGPRKLLFGVAKAPLGVDLGLLLLRVGLGPIMAVQHGWPKLSHFAERAAKFPDPLGVGSEVSLSLIVFGEFFCGLLLAGGLFSRPAALALAFGMGVAGIIHHAGDPFGDRELALVYCASFVALLVTGPGRFSLDRFLSKG